MFLYDDLVRRLSLATSVRSLINCRWRMEERREEGEEEVMEAASQNSLAEHIARMEIRFLSTI